MKEKEYHRFKTTNFFLSLGVNIFFILYFIYRGSFKYLETALSLYFNNYYMILFLYSSLFFFFLTLINFCFSLFEGYILERRFSLTKQNLSGWTKDYLKSQGLSYILFEIIVIFFYLALRKTGDLWWVYVGGFWLLFSLLLAGITPGVILPLFYKYKKVEDPHLIKILKDYLKRVDLGIDRVYSVDFSRKTKKSNAFICGLGKTRRLILADNLIKEFSHPEILSVVAHEAGHIKHRDVIRETVNSTFFTFMGLYTLNIFLKSWLSQREILFSEPSTLPLYTLFFIAFMFLVMPLQNYFLRRIEKQADIFCLKTTEDRESFISMMKKIAQKNLAEIKPPLWRELIFYTHPSIHRRIKLAQEFRYEK